MRNECIIFDPLPMNLLDPPLWKDNYLQYWTMMYCGMKGRWCHQ